MMGWPWSSFGDRCRPETGHLLSACLSLLLKVVFNLDALGASPVTSGVTQMLVIVSPLALPWGFLISLCL